MITREGIFAVLVLVYSASVMIACTPPTQATSHIDIAPGVADRLRWMDAVRAHDEQRQAMTTSQEHVVTCGAQTNSPFDDTVSSSDDGEIISASDAKGEANLTTETITVVPCRQVIR